MDDKIMITYDHSKPDEPALIAYRLNDKDQIVSMINGQVGKDAYNLYQLVTNGNNNYQGHPELIP